MFALIYNRAVLRPKSEASKVWVPNLGLGRKLSLKKENRRNKR